MKNFNLLISTSRFNEENAKAELWFTLLICGDQYPIISKLEFLGLINAFTNLNKRDVIKKIKEILIKDPYFFQYILKIVPIDIVCETNPKVIRKIIQNNLEDYLFEGETFKVVLKRRQHESIIRDSFIKYITKDINNKVNLDNPDKIIRIEILGNHCGIAFVKAEEILSIKYNNSKR
ncbi:MAG: THUMP domain-containing protein [Promethearchaeota archaeon]